MSILEEEQQEIHDLETEIEGFEEENEEQRSIYPLDRDKVQVVISNWPIFSLVDYLKRGIIELQPGFQRVYVRPDSHAEKLIDSIRNGLPIPQIFLLQKKDGKSIVIDGQQRLTSILRFFLPEEIINKIAPNLAANLGEERNVKLKVSQKIFGGDDNFVGIEDLTEEQKNLLETQLLTFTQIKPTYSSIDEKIAEEICKDIFSRLNTGGITLTDQEIRLSLYHGEFMSFLKEKSFIDSRTMLFPSKTKRFKKAPSLYSELLVRAFALFDAFSLSSTDTIGNIFQGEIKTKPFPSFLDHYASISDSFNTDQIENRKNILERTLNLLLGFSEEEKSNLFKHIEGSNIRSVFSVKYLDTILTGLFSLFREREILDKNKILYLITEFKTNEEILKNYIKDDKGIDEQYLRERVTVGINFFNDNYK